MRESTAGLRSGTTVLDHTVEVEVANRLPYPVAVEVRERVPVSTDKDVRIEEHQARPPWKEPDEPLAGQDGSYVRGARVWHVELAAGRTTTLTGGSKSGSPRGSRSSAETGGTETMAAPETAPDAPGIAEFADTAGIADAPGAAGTPIEPAALFAPVTAVTCLEDRAQIERTTAVRLTAGVQRLRIGPVTPLTVDRSLRAEISSPDGAISSPDGCPRPKRLPERRAPPPVPAWWTPASSVRTRPGSRPAGAGRIRVAP